MTPSPSAGTDCGQESAALLSAAGAALFAAPGLRAADLLRTPRLTEGPFYPDKVPLDTDNDLVRVAAGKPALGQVAHLTGRVVGPDGRPRRQPAAWVSRYKELLEGGAPE